MGEIRDRRASAFGKRITLVLWCDRRRPASGRVERAEYKVPFAKDQRILIGASPNPNIIRIKAWNSEMRNTWRIAIALSALMSASATSSIALADGAKPAWPLQPGNYQGGGSVAPAAQPFQAGDFVGGGGFAVAAKPFQPGDFSGGHESQLAAADSWTLKVGDLTEVINDDSRPVDFRGSIQELDIPAVAQGE